MHRHRLHLSVCVCPLFLHCRTQSNVASIKHILLQHQHKVIVASDKDGYQRVRVRIEASFKSWLQAFSKPHFNASKLLKLCIIAEQAEDEGGPRCEFFWLAT